MARPITIFVLSVLWGVFFYSFYVAMDNLLSNDILVTTDHENVHSFEFPSLIICSDGSESDNLANFADMFHHNNSIRVTSIQQYDFDLMNENLRENASINTSLNDILYTSVIQNPINEAFSVCYTFKPPMRGQIGLNKMVTMGIAVPEKLRGRSFYALACFRNEFIPVFNKLFGCDFVIITVPTTIPNHLIKHTGIEIGRVKKKNMDMVKNPCQTEDDDDIVDDLFDCFLSQIHHSAKCRISNKTSILGTAEKFCSTEKQFNATVKFMKNFMNALEDDVIEKTGCKPLCDTEHYSLTKRWEEISEYWLHLSPETTMAVSYFVQDSKVTVETQRKLYRLSNFLADIGGYLGLLLGVSCFSSYQIIKRFVARKFFYKKGTHANKKARTLLF